MRIRTLLLLFLIRVFCAKGQAGTTQEISSEDKLILRKMCDSTLQIECLTGNTGYPQKSEIFYKRNLKDCHERLRDNTFLWIDYQYFKQLEHLPSHTHIYVRKIADYTLNLENQRELTELTKKKLVLLELEPKALNPVKITQGRVWQRQRLPHRRIYPYYKNDIDGKITINDHRTTCLDFGGYIRVQERGKTDMKELKSSLCYKTLKELTVSNDIINKAKKSNVLSGRREIVISEAVVVIMVQKSDGVAFPITLKALVKEEKLAVESLKPKLKRY
ncbi:uncharacterized protein LOC129802649 [Phlebotomus papatasi]|uniref:uncharacterized protein LOC129802649 n=1 Tax=Phlebotomus papatasi TaxID=29031 RepID=UPI002484184A|nr:uncharacterized protein LOC129802649 [Phlebotomus papatasi]XP_055704602.1 uncharacterized protein LOC129802649 [Phlebotomus papatasi]XP_055704603.1 uncharacterized protein LOC129802649 [Phlebotomus papatasi]XP_055704604.1 uncharacterized protein LOC129802649 [Phlebotomus papatasi]